MNRAVCVNRCVFVLFGAIGIGHLNAFQGESDPLVSMLPLVLCQEPQVQIIVGSIAAVQGNGRWTFGNPPQLQIRAELVLKGLIKSNDLRSAIWLPDPKAQSRMRLSQQAWSEIPMRPPKVGERFILLASEQKGTVLRIGPQARFRPTPERLRYIKTTLQTPERDLCGPSHVH